MKLFWFIVHTFIGCDESDATWFKNNLMTCNKCGRRHIIFKQ